MAAPTVTAVSAPTGYTTGGATVLISGTNLTGLISVTFGGAAATSFEAVGGSGTAISAVVPAHAAGAVDVVVTTFGGSGTGTGVFTYTAAASPAYSLTLWDDCCHVFLSDDTGDTFTIGATPGSASTPPPNDSGFDPHGIGTLLDAWSDGEMAINDADYNTLVGFDEFYNTNYGIVAFSATRGSNLSYSLVDPEAFSPAFSNDPDHSTSFRRGAISGNGEVILAMPYTYVSNTSEDFYPRISRDSGATWSNVTGLDASVTWAACCFGSTASGVMYAKPLASAPGGRPVVTPPAYLRKSTDWGVTWTALSSGPDATPTSSAEGECRLRCSADGQVVVLIDLTGNFWVSQDGGANWTHTDFAAQLGTTGGNTADCSVTPDGTTIILCFEQHITGDLWPAVFVSTDSGANFTDVSSNLQYPATYGGPGVGANRPTGCGQCNVSSDGLGMVVTFGTINLDPGIVYPDDLTGDTLYCNVSTDAGTTWKLCSFGADPYELNSVLGFFTGVYITPSTPPSPPSPPPMPPAPTPTTGAYYIERMDDRLWNDIEDSWCVDCALAYPMPTPDATLSLTSGSGSANIALYTVIAGGSGYTAPIGQLVDAAGNGTGASVSFTVSGGVITAASASTIGSGYLQPTLTVLDTTGTGAIVQPIVTNYVTLSASTAIFTSTSVGDIVRVGGGKLEVVWSTSSGTTNACIANVIVPVATIVPDDPDNTVITAASGEWTQTTPTSSVSGLDHLEGMTVAALADGGVVSDLVVTAGSVTLPVPATAIVVGLPFTAQLQTLYMETPGAGTVQTRRKNIVQVVARVQNSRAPELGVNQPDASCQPNQMNIAWTGMTQVEDRIPTMTASLPIPLYSGDYGITNVFGQWDQRGQIAVQQTKPVPLTVLALVPWVQVGDTPGS